MPTLSVAWSRRRWGGHDDQPSALWAGYPSEGFLAPVTCAPRALGPGSVRCGAGEGLAPDRRYGIETVLKRPLTAGAVQRVLAAPELLLVIDGVSEVSADTRASLSSDLDQLAAQRPVRVIAAGRDLPLTIAGVGLPDSTAVFRVTGLDHDGRMKLAAAHGHQQAVRTIEHRLGSAADNPMLFLMALITQLLQKHVKHSETLRS